MPAFQAERSWVRIPHALLVVTVTRRWGLRLREALGNIFPGPLRVLGCDLRDLLAQLFFRDQEALEAIDHRAHVDA